LITIPLMPLLISEVVFAVTKWHHNRKNIVGTFYKVEMIFKMFVVAQALLISLKADNIVPWEWREIFTAYWIVFSIMVGLTFAFMLMFVSKCCAYMFAEMEIFEVRGIFWLFTVVGGKTVLSCILTLEVIGVFQNNDNKDGLLGILITIPVYSAGVALYTWLFRKEIESLFKKISAFEEAPTAEEASMAEATKNLPRKNQKKLIFQSS